MYTISNKNIVPFTCIICDMSVIRAGSGSQGAHGRGRIPTEPTSPRRPFTCIDGPADIWMLIQQGKEKCLEVLPSQGVFFIFGIDTVIHIL